jgi:hypothetical protein
MRMFKFSSIAVLALLMMTAFMPELSAKHHRRSHRSTFTSFGFNLNVNPVRPVYQSTYVMQPAYERVTYVQAPTYVQPVSYYTSDRVYYPVYQEEVVVQRPVYSRTYIQPQFSYWNY